MELCAQLCVELDDAIEAASFLLKPRGHQMQHCVQREPLQTHCEAGRREDCSGYFGESDEVVHGRLPSVPEKGRKMTKERPRRPDSARLVGTVPVFNRLWARPLAHQELIKRGGNLERRGPQATTVETGTRDASRMGLLEWLGVGG